MRKTLGSIFLVILIFIGSIIFTEYANGSLGIFILTLMFVFFVSRFFTLMMNKSKSVAYKIISGAFIALTISLLFYVLFGHVNNNFTNSGFFTFFLNMISVTVLPVGIGLILLIYTVVKRRTEKQE